jgi:hypothetical protein
MDADRIRLGETALEDLIDWLRRNGRPQTLDALAYQYVAMLRERVLEDKEAEK